MIRTFSVCLALLWLLIGDSAFAQITDRITKVDDPGHAGKAIERPALASSPSGIFGVLVHGTPAAGLSKLIAPPTALRAGTLEGFDEGDAVAIGRGLAERLSLGVGDGITLAAPGVAEGATGGPPRFKTYKIAAVFETGVSSYDDAFVFMPVREAKAYFGL
jgi:lipoprotein-releasing system permease protein